MSKCVRCVKDCLLLDSDAGTDREILRLCKSCFDKDKNEGYFYTRKHSINNRPEKTSKAIENICDESAIAWEKSVANQYF